jgi:hypothetical protein
MWVIPISIHEDWAMGGEVIEMGGRNKRVSSTMLVHGTTKTKNIVRVYGE